MGYGFDGLAVKAQQMIGADPRCRRSQETCLSDALAKPHFSQFAAYGGGSDPQPQIPLNLTGTGIDRIAFQGDGGPTIQSGPGYNSFASWRDGGSRERRATRGHDGQAHRAPSGSPLLR